MLTAVSGFKPPLSAPQREEVIDSKQLIFQRFRQALAEGVNGDDAPGKRLRLIDQ